MSKRVRLLLLAGLLVGAGLWWVDDQLNTGLVGALKPAADPPEPTVILVVLDTFRADEAGLCGGSVPTPTLEALAQQEGTLSTCRAYTPAPWTLPSHASYFTGVPVLEHGAHSWVQGGGDIVHTQKALALDGRHPTLAEDFGARGFQTLSWSGNPVLGPETGLVRGFERHHAPETFSLRGERYVEGLERALVELDGDRPLFVVLNIADAHGPWPAVPQGLDWVAPTPEVSDQRNDYYALPPQAWDQAIAERREAYRYALHQADRTLGLTLALLQERGWYDPERDRLIITTDHGEMLGEGDVLFHGGNTLEGNMRSLLVARGVSSSSLVEPASTMEVHPLALSGEPAGYPVEGVAFPMASMLRATQGELTGRWLSLWEGGLKYTWHEGALSVQDLRQGGEPEPTDDPGPLGPAIERLEAYQPELSDVDPGLNEMLKAAGYVE